MAKAKAKAQVKTDQVVVLTTDAHDLVIRSNPTNAEVRRFVKEHNRRWLEGQAGGPDGSFARRIDTATRFVNELHYLTGGEGETVKIKDIIKR